MIKVDVIEPENTDLASPVVLVPQKGRFSTALYRLSSFKRRHGPRFLTNSTDGIINRFIGRLKNVKNPRLQLWLLASARCRWGS